MRTRRILLMLTVCALTVLPVGMLALPGFQPAAALAGSQPGFYSIRLKNDQLEIPEFELFAHLNRDGNFISAGLLPSKIAISQSSPLIGLWQGGSSNALEIKALVKLVQLHLDGQDIQVEPNGKALFHGTFVPVKDRKDVFEGEAALDIYDETDILKQHLPLQAELIKIRIGEFFTQP
jgi:hypothetical protein